MVKNTYEGSCLCGSIQFSTDKLNRDDVWFCHCSQCRKSYGMYGAFIGVPRKELKISGSENIRWYKSSQKFRRGFCKKCGSGIIWENPKWETTYLLAGLFEKLNRKKGIHIFTKDKGGYYNICDTLPQFKSVPK